MSSQDYIIYVFCNRLWFATVFTSLLGFKLEANKETSWLVKKSGLSLIMKSSSYHFQPLVLVHRMVLKSKSFSSSNISIFIQWLGGPEKPTNYLLLVWATWNIDMSLWSSNGLTRGHFLKRGWDVNFNFICFIIHSLVEGLENSCGAVFCRLLRCVLQTSC